MNSAVVVRSILLKQTRVMAGPGEWSELSSKQRGDLLYRLAELIDQEKEALALLGTSTRFLPLSLSGRALAARSAPETHVFIVTLCVPPLLATNEQSPLTWASRSSSRSTLTSSRWSTPTATLPYPFHPPPHPSSLFAHHCARTVRSLAFALRSCPPPTLLFLSELCMRVLSLTY